MKKIFSTITVLLVLVGVSFAETDYIALPIIDDIQSGADNVNQIRTLRVQNDATIGGDLTVSGALGGTPDSVGAVGATGESVVESYGVVNKSLITLNNSMTATDGSAEGETEKIYTFPEGRIYILGAAIDVTIVNTATEADANDVFVVAIGSAAAADDAALTSTEADIIASTEYSDGAVTLTNAWEGDMTSGADSVFDGTTTPASLNLNMGIADASITTNNFTATFTGTLAVYWINLGDD